MIEGSWRDGVVEASAGIHVMGELSGPVPSPGEPAVAVFRPNAVAVYRSRPDGSPRNVFAAAITELEPRGDQIRVSAGELSADITAQAAAELDLALGTEAYFVVKATEIAVYRA
jgi:molybdate transport system ATP-binding protein